MPITTRNWRDEAGFNLIEMMVSIALLLVVSGTVLTGVLGLTDVNRTVSNRTDMHSAVRNATELLTQEIGQAGRIALPGTATLNGTTLLGVTAFSVSSTAANADTKATAGMFAGQLLLVGAGNTQEVVVVADVGDTTVTLVSPTKKPHSSGVPVSAIGGFAEGVVPPAALGYINGSTPSILKIFGDIHDDGRMVYVEYQCDVANGRLYRNSMAFDTVGKVAPTVEQILIDNIEANPVNPDGTSTPCFTYQTETVNGRRYVVDVAVTLTIRSQARDKNTGDFQRETKALLNVAPRNVFNVWQMAGLGLYDRIQPVPAPVTALLPNLVSVESQY